MNKEYKQEIMSALKSNLSKYDQSLLKSVLDEKNLVKAEVMLSGDDAWRNASNLIDAFISPFPSLESQCSGQLLWFAMHAKNSKNIPAIPAGIIKTLKKDATEQDWGGSIAVQRTATTESDGNLTKDTFVKLIPYVGDRCLILKVWDKDNIVVEFDYTKRPSLFAAGDVIEILCYNVIAKAGGEGWWGWQRNFAIFES